MSARPLLHLGQTLFAGKDRGAAWVRQINDSQVNPLPHLQCAVACHTVVLHGESSKRLATPRNTKDKKHLQSCHTVVSRHNAMTEAWAVALPPAAESPQPMIRM